MNLVERFVRDLTVDQLCRITSARVPELICATKANPDQYDEFLKPSRTARANGILRKSSRANH